MRDDLERLAASCRRWSREPRNGVARSRPATIPATSPRRAIRSSTPINPTITRTTIGRRRNGCAARRAAASAWSRQVRAEWQEKLLALRMQSLFGRRFVAILENTVLVLILVLFGLIAAQVVLERTSPSGLSVRQHEFFAWADLAICSVFLFEFALKLALAPNRMTYFARHFLIDLVASLPFGFVFHQIALDQLENAAAGAGPHRGRSGLLIRSGGSPCGSSGWPCRFSGCCECRSSS